jgi:response regulator RpfG family c-di-GMP phosphodiesterase
MVHPSGNPRLPEWLVAKGLLSPEQREAALNQQQLMGGRIEDALVDAGIAELELLKFLASLYRTRFVSSEKLAKAHIDRVTLDKIPKKLAEQATAFPVLYDQASSTLSVVVADPEDQELLKQIQLASSVRNIKPFVGRPLAIKAAIAKNYSGDIHAFAKLDKRAHEEFSHLLNVFERNLVSEESMAVALVADEGGRERTLSPEQLSLAPAAAATDSLTGKNYLETLNVLVSLLENGRAELRGHSAQVARLVEKISERIGVSESTLAAFCIAAHLHDLGKMGEHHLTPLNVAINEQHQKRAQQIYLSPLKLMEAVRLPREASDAIEFMYERFAGDGLPGNKTGKDIPLGARLLAIADTYADLTRNPLNRFGRVLDAGQACEILKRYSPSLFDPNLVELFRLTVTGDSLRARLLANRHLALVVDPDPEESTVLELRMIEHGFEVRVARSSGQALKELETGEIELVVSELDLKPSDGFALLKEARDRAWGKGLPWVVMTARTSRQDANRAFELGADDYVNKPVSADLFVTKLKQIIERGTRRKGSRGVAGSLQEMGLPEIVQVLWHGRKSGSLKIRAQEGSGEIHFVEGQVYNALFGSKRGAEAFYAMVTLKAGDFSVDPSYVAPQRVIEDSPEGLLLEGMRRMDEGAI